MTFKIKFQPDGRVIHVPGGTTVKEAARLAGIVIDTPCGGTGTCGKCLVQVISGSTEISLSDRKFLSEDELLEGYRLSCMLKSSADLVVRIPDETRLHVQKILTHGEEKEFKVNPTVEKIFLELTPPALNYQVSDFENLKENVIKSTGKPIYANLKAIRELPHIIRSSDFKITATLDDSELINIEPHDTRNECYGMCFDIGTTTVVGAIVDLNTGREAAISSRMNDQVIYGDDIIFRINLTINDKNGLSKLHNKVIEVINTIIEDAALQAGISRNKIYSMTAVGNTTMHHLLLGIPPQFIASAPYIPVVKELVKIKAHDLGIEIHPNANLRVLPNISAFVGSDSVGVMLASQLHRGDDIRLAIDIGTNGEIMLGNKDRILASSTAAGPAFEGIHIRHGMRASAGAIESVHIIDGKVQLGVIGGGVPVGICGSGIVDAISEMLKEHLIDETGRMAVPSFSLFKDDHKDIAITQKDVREIQVAKGAIQAGIEILKKELDIKTESISEILLAGAFGNYIKKESALRLGLIPSMGLERVRSIGNAAFVGSKMALCSKDAIRESIEIAGNTEQIELSGRPDFQEEFANAMLFPVVNSDIMVAKV